MFQWQNCFVNDSNTKAFCKLRSENAYYLLSFAYLTNSRLFYRYSFWLRNPYSIIYKTTKCFQTIYLLEICIEIIWYQPKVPFQIACQLCVCRLFNDLKALRVFWCAPRVIGIAVVSGLSQAHWSMPFVASHVMHWDCFVKRLLQRNIVLQKENYFGLVTHNLWADHSTL